MWVISPKKVLPYLGVKNGCIYVQNENTDILKGPLHILVPGDRQLCPRFLVNDAENADFQILVIFTGPRGQRKRFISWIYLTVYVTVYGMGLII